MPIHRLFAFFLSRAMMSYYAHSRLETAEESKEPVSTDFASYLVSAGIMSDAHELQELLENALVTGAI